MFENFNNKHKSLKNLFLKNNGKLIHKWHHYFDIYERHFSKFVNKPVNILEIGVYEGGSLQMWKKYFGKRANIYAIDINPECKAHEEKRVKIFIGDQTDRKFLKDVLNQIPNKIDIVIDDGGHSVNQNIVSFEELYYKISDRGVYLIEDLHVANYWRNSEFRDREDGLDFMDYARDQLDLLNGAHDSKIASPSFKKILYRYYSIDPAKRESNMLELPEFTRVTDGIHFYDSIVVYEKKPKEELFSEKIPNPNSTVKK